MQGLVLRLSNCFGYPATKDNECWNLVLNQFIKEAYESDRITIRGEYQGRRDFLPITELNRILFSLLELSEIRPKVINVSTGSTLTLLEAAEIVSKQAAKKWGKQVEIVKDATRGKDYDLSIRNEALKDLGISPQRSVSSEIELMMDFLDR